MESDESDSVIVVGLVEVEDITGWCESGSSMRTISSDAGIISRTSSSSSSYPFVNQACVLNKV